MRNKKLIWSKLANVTAEGKAEYEKALAKAFTTLMNLKPSQLEWKTKEEIEKEKDEGGGLDPQKEYIHLNEHFLVVDRSYIDAINNFSGNTKMGCNDVIMLVTDGAPDFYKDVFELYNKHKQVRFFSFLVGEEATDFEQVRWMACNNRGFMVHISNLADILEKIQHYVRVLSRPISHQATNINQESAVWSSIARERMSNEFVISVGYPVIVEEAIMGVAAVSIPLIEVQQIAHFSYIGSRSYYFMLDNNGYTMFHPQLDQFDSVTNEVKPIFNNLDFSEVEVTPPMHKKPKPGFINCDDDTPKELTVLFSTEDIRRVYIQKNTYHSECLDGTQFTLGLAVAEGDEVRLQRKGLIDWNSVDLEWMRGKNWRIHPKWRYCLLNDSDTQLGPEAAFQVYAKHMRDYGELPVLCRARRRLIDRLLLDMQATTDFSQLWDEEWTKNKESGIHLTFFATPSGLIRFANQSLEEYAYEKPKEEQAVKTYGYQHFILQQNKNSVEDEYFKRAVRQKGKIVFDVNRGSHLWYKRQEQSFFGHKENVSLLGVAYKALYTNDALIGVAGVEFLYDKLAERMKEFGCKPDDDTQRCFLIDEHAYVLYSSQKETEYTNVVKNETRKSTKTVLGSFFGHLNRVTEWTMEVLIKKGFYSETTYWDNQAMCDKIEATAASSIKLTTIYRQFLTILKYFYRQALKLVSAISQSPSTALSTFFALQPRKAEAFTTTFKPNIDRLPCRTKSKFYLANTERKGTATAALLEENYAERPCKQNAAQCAVKVYAAWVENTNLLMVVIKQGQRSSCYDDKHCPLAKTVPFGFERLTQLEMKQREKQRFGSGELDDDDEGPRSQCPSTKPHHRKTVAQCLREPPQLKELDPELRPCSMTSTRIISSALLLSALLLFRL
uniref:VGCC_alpha2 domain-containing protein n=1 Tax=Bursaphelenchus xylophilus TaxID=6326 RepID=A0A1I7RU69_BURXY